MKNNKIKARAGRLIAKLNGFGQGRKYCKQHDLISSVSSMHLYHSYLCQYLKWLQINKRGLDQQDSLESINHYLEEATEVYQQVTLDGHKRVLELVFHKKLKKFESLVPKNYTSRFYNLSEILLIIHKMQSKNALGVLICFYAGLRAHELGTLKRINEGKKSSTRKWDERRFMGIENYVVYLVQGKGGLVREVAIPTELSIALELRRFNVPKKISDRGLFRYLNYDIGHGQALSQAFTRASMQALGWSTGIHGCRHAYAQKRISKLEYLNITFEATQKIVSQELGHFRPQVINCYLP